MLSLHIGPPNNIQSFALQLKFLKKSLQWQLVGHLHLQKSYEVIPQMAWLFLFRDHLYPHRSIYNMYREFWKQNIKTLKNNKHSHNLIFFCKSLYVYSYLYIASYSLYKQIYIEYIVNRVFRQWFPRQQMGWISASCTGGAGWWGGGGPVALMKSTRTPPRSACQSPSSPCSHGPLSCGWLPGHWLCWSAQSFCGTHLEPGENSTVSLCPLRLDPTHV